MTSLQIAELLFCVNSRDQGSGMDSPISRFFGRGVKSSIPNSLNRSFAWSWALQNRCQQKQLLFEKKGRSKKEQFAVDEVVRVQNLKTGDWKQTGIITGLRTSNDNQILSYTLSLNGFETMRHRKFLKKYIPTRGADIDEDVPSGDDESPPDDSDIVEDDDHAGMRVPRPNHGPIMAADRGPVSSRLRSRAKLARICHSSEQPAEVVGAFDITKAGSEEAKPEPDTCHTVTCSEMPTRGLPSCTVLLCGYAVATTAISILFVALYATECSVEPMVSDLGDKAATVVVKQTQFDFLNLHEQGESEYKATETEGCPPCSNSHCFTELNLLEVIALTVICLLCIKYLVRCMMEGKIWLLKKREARETARAERYRALYSPSAPATGSAGVISGVTIEGPSTSPISYPSAGSTTSSPHQSTLITDGAVSGARVAQSTLSFVDS